jgi:uncharacterized membrane protein YedE/YeeE
MNEVDPAQLIPYVQWGGFALAFVFGFVGNKTHFCTMGAVSDIVNMGDWSRMRMWLLAIAVAILGTCAMQAGGLIDTRNSIYTSSNFIWLSHLVGGLLFGVGMTLGSGCGSKTLIRVGTGNLKSLIVVVFMAISAYMTLRGLFGALRVNALDAVAVQLPANQDLPSLLAHAFGGDRATLALIVSLAVAGLLLAFVFIRRSGWSADVLLGGVVTGLMVVGGWYVTGMLGYVAEDPNSLEQAWVATNSGRMESLSFVAPQAFLLEWLMLWTDTSRIITFGIAIALGMVAGSFAYALISRTWRIESFRDAGDLLNHMLGGVLMGFGGITALGCTIGQGISGFSTLALGSILTFAAIVTGSAATMKYQYWRLMREE